MKSALKRSARRLVDRAITPHLDRQTTDFARVLDQRLAVPAPQPVLPPLLRGFNLVLHELRTIELRTLPATGKVLLSAGCSGAWYFEWLEACAGPFEHHVGVELYMPRPDRMPTGTTWIAESASHMPSVADASVDVVYSGQNFEHLWIDDMVGFLAESHRVLRPGGLLVVDSPNRLATEQLAWTHTEHTIELTIAEATELFELAGFEVVSVRGLWACRAARTNEWLPLIPPMDDVAQILDRSVRREPADDTFIWWIEARRSDRGFDRDGVAARVADLFAEHWPTRVMRGAERPAGERADGVVVRCGPLPLFAGHVRIAASDNRLGVRALRPDGSEIVAGTGEVAADLPATEFGVMIELVAEPPLTEPPAAADVTVHQAPTPADRNADDS